MRAKLALESVLKTEHGEDLIFRAVPKTGSYPESGLDEDNTFAKFSPSAEFKISVRNPALFGRFAPGERFYVDITPAPALHHSRD